MRFKIKSKVSRYYASIGEESTEMYTQMQENYE